MARRSHSRWARRYRARRPRRRATIGMIVVLFALAILIVLAITIVASC
jgi:hypothetical protein